MALNPRIALTTSLELLSERFYLGRQYCEAVAHFGAVPMLLGLIPKREYVSLALDGADGVLLPGSDTDVDPYRYGAEPHPAFKRNIPVKDETDLLVIEEAEKRNLPLLAICYGMQILNVARGGTLIQDIGKLVPGALMHDQGEPFEWLSHGVRIDDLSRLHRLVEKGRARVNSHHHQSVKDLGEHLFASALAEDSLIEAVEDDRAGRFVVGVQWHPELSFKDDEFSRSIFRDFVAECGKSADAKP